MSGIVGIVHFDGAPVDRHLLGQMTGFLAFRGPDAQEIWIDGNVGFGHTLLKTTDESEHERQPFTLDGQVWIVADARVDARRELIPQLQGPRPRRSLCGRHRCRTDPARLPGLGRALRRASAGRLRFRHLGRRRGSACSALAINSGSSRSSTPTSAETLIFSNSLDCIRQHPVVSDRLNDLAIADFLLFDLNQDLATTSFRRHPALASRPFGDSGRPRRLRTAPLLDSSHRRAALFPRAMTTTSNRFSELLDQAVEDRLRTKKVGVIMSGGLDSPTLAATACQNSSRWRVVAIPKCALSPPCIDGWTATNATTPDWSAEHLGIPIHFQRFDREKLIDPDWAKASVRTPEPVARSHEPRLPSAGNTSGMADYSRVSFYGEGPDNALRPRMEALSSLFWCGKGNLAGWRGALGNW